jgi:uncharacterized protein YbjT (DUF2867 family)
MSVPGGRPRLLLVGGSGGLLGRALLPELAPSFQLRSVHRHPAPAEATLGTEWIQADIAEVAKWAPLLDSVDVVVNVAWHRYGNARRFRRLHEGLRGLVEASRTAGVRRFVHISVPEAPPDLEAHLPYLAYKRAFDRDLAASGLSYRILRPTMLFGHGDRLLGVMLRLMRRYHRFPMFGDGEYHVSPIAVVDVARAIRLEAQGEAMGTSDLGGPQRFRYRDLTDRMFAMLGRPPRYVRLSPRMSIALGQLVQDLGSTLLYAYEVEWLLSDRLGLAPYEGLDRPLTPVEPYLRAEARWLGGERPRAAAARGESA